MNSAGTAGSTPWQGRAKERQRRILSTGLRWEGTAKDLFRQIRKHLLDASASEHIKTPPHEILRLIKLTPKTDEEIAITGGEKDFGRTFQRPHFKRADGAGFDFVITLREKKGGTIELLAYDYELRFPPAAIEASTDTRLLPTFLRFDLNLPGHDNEHDALRCHLHPGADDILVPAPLLGPLEMLDLFLYEIAPRDPERRRA